MAGYVGTCVTIALDYDSPHTELLLNDVCLTNLCEESLTAVWTDRTDVSTFSIYQSGSLLSGILLLL
jgi:hypothetical protein